MVRMRQFPGSGYVSSAIVGTALCWAIGIIICGVSVAVAVEGSLATRLFALTGLMAGAAVCGWAQGASPQWKLRLVAILILTGIGTIGTEAGLRFFSRYPLQSTSRLIPDAEVGFTLDPSRDDVDQRGFRNAERNGSPYAVAIGDGLTEGVNVPAQASWPACLERLLGNPVYNMGVSCFGPREYLRSVKTALALEPQHIVICVNLGDDFGSSREKGLTTPPGFSCRNFLKCQTAIGSYLHHKWKQFSAVSESMTLCSGTEKIHVRERDIQALATNLDPNDVRVAGNVRETTSALRSAAKACQQRGVRLTVMLVPCAVSVYSTDTNTEENSQWAQHIAVNERRLVESIRNGLMDSPVDLIDVLPTIQSAIGAGQSPYDQGGTRYPSATGYAIYASTVAPVLSRNLLPATN